MEAPGGFEERAGTHSCHLESKQAEAGEWGWRDCLEAPTVLPGGQDDACTRVAE